MLQFFLTFLAAFHWFLVIFCHMLQSFKDYNLFKGGQCSLYHQKGTFDVLEIHKIKYLRLNHLHFKFRYFYDVPFIFAELLAKKNLKSQILFLCNTCFGHPALITCSTRQYFYRTRVRSLAMLVTNWLTDSLTP